MIGTEADQTAHAEAMAGEKAGGMDGDAHSMGGDDHSMHHGAVVVEPGQVRVTSKAFDEPGTLVIGCHQPGHYEAGMRATVGID